MSRRQRGRVTAAARLGQAFAWGAWLMVLHGAVLELGGDATPRGRLVLLAALGLIGAMLARLCRPSARLLVGASLFAALMASASALAQAPDAGPPPGDDDLFEIDDDDVDALVPPAPSEGDVAPPADAREVGVDEVVVTGSRIEQSAASAAVATEVLDRDAIEQSGARDAAELLEERAGLQLQRSFRGTELWLRGMDPRYSLILVDGDRVPGRVGGAIDLSRYGVENIGRVEVVRGPSSALYGSDAIGGVVNLITRDSDRELEADGMLSYGLNNVVDATARVAGIPDEHLRLRLNGGLHYADPFRRGDAEATTGSSRLQWSVGARADWRPNSHNRTRVQADYLWLELRGVDEGAGTALFDRTQLQEQMRVSAEHMISGPDGLRLITRVTYNQYREQYLLDQRGGSQLDSYEDNREHSAQVTTLARFVIHELGTHTVTVGFEEYMQILESARITERGRRSRFAVLAQDEWIPWEDGDASLTVVPGLRFDVDSQFGDQLSPKLSLRFDPVRQVIVRASYGRGFRAPSFQQLLLRFENPSVGYVVTGNPDLGAETSHGVDVSAQWRPVDALTVSVGFFRNDLEDMIATVTVDEPGATGSLFSYANLATAWTMGLESTATLRVEDYVGIVAGYTLTTTWDGEHERQLEGRALHRITLATRFAYEPWEISLVARGALMLDRVYYRDLDMDGAEEAVVPDPIAQVDLRLAKRFTRHLELFVGIDNLLDAGDAYTVLRPFTVYGGARGRY